MITQRQKQIFYLLQSSADAYIKGIQLAKELDCSLKTLQTDIKELKQILETYEIELLSVTSKGYSLQIHDPQRYEEWKLVLNNSEQREDFNDQSYRISYILSELLKNDEYVKSDDLADEMYVSRSSISSDIRIVKKILEKYALRIEHKPNYGMLVVGLEKDKRDCIIKEQLGLHTEAVSIHKEWIPIISDVVVDNLMKAKYRISDVVLQNLVLHICVAIQRMSECIYVENTKSLPRYGNEHQIAQHILQDLAEIFHFEAREDEIRFLGLHLLGKRSYEESDLISSKTDQFVNEMLVYVKTKTNIDFSGDVELKISLALHLVPLFVRLENQMQLQNNMITDIQTNFPLAYDVAVIATSYIRSQKQWIVSKDEIAYLAVHFSLSLSKKENKINPKRILIICNARRGDYLMMQHTFLKEFHEMIAELDIINALEIPQYDLQSYDCIFATFLNHPLIPSNALRINFFIDHKDIARIKRALSGVGETQELLRYFQETYFLGKSKASSQTEVLKEMCALANQCNEFDEDLYTACMRREQLGSTAYGHLIALPHPDSLISKKTTVITTILDHPIIWSGQKAQLIFLICVETGNHKDLRVLFECISKFMMDERSVQEVIDKGDYKTFMNNLGKLIG